MTPRSGAWPLSVSDQRRLVAMALVGGVIALAACSESATPNGYPGWESVEAGPAVSFEYHALTDRGLAIERALQFFPEGEKPNQAIARLTTEFRAVTWRDDATPRPGDYDPNRLAGPVQLVIPGVGRRWSLPVAVRAVPDRGGHGVRAVLQ